LLAIVQVEAEQIQLPAHRHQGLDRLVVEIAGQARALLGGGELARLRGQARVVDGLGDLPGQTLQVRDVVGRESVHAFAFDVQDADGARAELEWDVELGASSLAPGPGDVARLAQDVVDQAGPTMSRDPARQSAAQRHAKRAR
jgi:hypothetical protein